VEKIIYYSQVKEGKVMSFLKDFLFGTKGSTEQLPTMNPQQLQMLSQWLGGVSGQLPGAFDQLGQMIGGQQEAPWEQAAKRQFSEQTVPQLADLFSGIGEGAQHSSAFGQQLSSAGASLAERLAAGRQAERQQGLQSLFNLLQGAVQQRPFGYREEQGQPGFLNNIVNTIGQLGGYGLGSGLLGLLSGKGFKGGVQSYLGG